MTEHPTKDWEWEDTAEVAFQEWFNGEYGNFTFRSEWFFGDCEVEDVKTRQEGRVNPLGHQILTGLHIPNFTISKEPFTTECKITILSVEPFLKCDFGSIFPFPI